MISYLELRLVKTLQLSNRSPWSSTTKKGSDSLVVRMILTQSLSDCLLSNHTVVILFILVVEIANGNVIFCSLGLPSHINMKIYMLGTSKYIFYVLDQRLLVNLHMEEWHRHIGI